MCGAVRAPPGLISVCPFIQPWPRFGRSCPVSGPAGSGTPSSGTALAPLLQLGVPATLLLLPHLGTLGLLWLPASRGCSEERQQGGFGQDTPCYVPSAPLQDGKMMRGWQDPSPSLPGAERGLLLLSPLPAPSHPQTTHPWVPPRPHRSRGHPHLLSPCCCSGVR